VPRFQPRPFPDCNRTAGGPRPPLDLQQPPRWPPHQLNRGCAGGVALRAYSSQARRVLGGWLFSGLGCPDRPAPPAHAPAPRWIVGLCMVSRPRSPGNEPEHASGAEEVRTGRRPFRLTASARTAYTPGPPRLEPWRLLLAIRDAKNVRVGRGKTAYAFPPSCFAGCSPADASRRDGWTPEPSLIREPWRRGFKTDERNSDRGDEGQ